jgi:hypothetical protein
MQEVEMGQSRVLHSHMSSQRDSWWYLVQDDNGALFIDYENDVSPHLSTSLLPRIETVQ